MEKVFNLFFIFFGWSMTRASYAANFIALRKTSIPILIYTCLNVFGNQMFDYMDLNFGKVVKIADIKSTKVYYGDSDSLQDRDININRLAPVEYICNQGTILATNPSCSIKNSEVDNLENEVLLKSGQKLFSEVNFFRGNLQTNLDTALISNMIAK